MAGFPKLLPAFTCHVVLEVPITIGAVSSGTSLTLAPFQPAGFLKSEADYPLKVDAVFVHGSDYIRQDPNTKQVRLDVNSVLRDQSGAIIKFSYWGNIALTESTAKVLGGAEGAKTTEFGDALTHVQFETGSDELRELERGVFVASGRFILEHGKPVTVEYKISQVFA